MADMVNVRAPSSASQYKAPQARMGRSQISLSHSHKTSFDAGRLIPYVVEEVVPGDTFTCKLTLFARVFSPLDAPIMDDIMMNIDFFFVPTRLLWDNWKNFLGEHDAAGAQDTTYTVPRIANGITITEDSVAHYMGVPIGLSSTAESVNCLPIRAYYRCYNEWYRDQNIIDESANAATGDGPSSIGNGNPLKTAKMHDYFTSALPYLQKGTAQTVVQSDAPIYVGVSAGSTISVYSTGDADDKLIDTGAAQADVSVTAGSTDSQKMYADLSASFSINALREAAAIQRMLERDARGGTRHPEIIRSHFGVDVPDYRTQRAEYLGGGTGYINVSPVANTSDTTGRDQGELAGTAAGTLRASWAKSFVEHGYIIGMLRARGQVSYFQGLDRMWSRSDKYDFLWPELAQLGEQPIYNKELFLVGDATDDNVFGYQERYADYRYKKSLITGEFDPNHSVSLDFWHLAEDFSGQPSLNQTFIEDQTPMARVTTVDTQHDFIVDGRVDLRVARILPVRPVPTLMPARF